MDDKSLNKIAMFFGFIILSVLLCNMARAEVFVNFSIVPELREIVGVPSGYVECVNVDGGIYEDVWHSPHRICYYGNTPDAGAWISGYWGCTYWTDSDECLDWNWYPAHWVRKGYWEYGLRWHRHHPWFWWREQHHHFRSKMIGGHHPYRDHHEKHPKFYDHKSFKKYEFQDHHKKTQIFEEKHGKGIISGDHKKLSHENEKFFEKHGEKSFGGSGTGFGGHEIHQGSFGGQGTHQGRSIGGGGSGGGHGGGSGNRHH